jgi:DNA-binding beta-propeller fold protein YncE
MKTLFVICSFALLLPRAVLAGQVLTPVASWSLDYTHNGLAVAPNGNVYAIDGYNGTVEYFTPAGALLGSWTASNGGGPEGLAVDPQGFVYVAYRNAEVEKFTATGAHVSGFLDTHCDHASGIAVDKAGNIYVGGYLTIKTVSEFDSAGNFIREFPSEVVFRLQVDGDGNLYTVGGGIVEKFSPTGAVLAKRSGPIGCSTLSPEDIALDGEGHVTVANYTNNNVLFLSADLDCLTAFVMDGTLPLPAYLACDPAGYLYVADVMHDRVVKYKYDVSTPAATATWGKVKATYR